MVQIEMSVAPVILEGPLQAVEVSAQTTLGVFLRQVERFGERTFVRFYDEESMSWTALTWNGFRGRVLDVARGLAAAGVRPQDRVLLLSENRVEWLYCDLGIQAAGAITVPVYANLVVASVRAIAEDSEPALAIVSDASQAAKFSTMAHPPPVVSMESDIPSWLAGVDAPLGVEVEMRLRGLRPQDVATIAYTSGTSGRPKGAVITHGIIVGELESCRKAYDIRPDDVILSILPYAHIFERIAAFYFGSIMSGAELSLGRGVDHLLDDLHTIQPTCMDAVPRIFEKVTQRVEAEMRSRSPLTRAVFAWSMRTGRQHVRAARPGWWLRLRYGLADRLALHAVRRRITGGRLRFFMSGSAPLLPDVEEFFWAIGVPIYQGYGMTEVTCVATCNTIAEHRLGTVGKPLPGVQIRLAPDGEIELRSPGVMREYHRNPTATAQAMSDGWFLTGDVGRVDGDGFLTITDRKKDLIKTSGGKYVAPQPIEVRLQQDPHIQFAIVVGDGRRYVTALIVPDWALVSKELGLNEPPELLVGDPRVAGLIQERVDEVNGGLDRFETVKYFRLLARPLTVESDELTPSLKVRRRAVQEHYRDLIDAMYTN
jgi:long-chain acyl-CoA synthetase